MKKEKIHIICFCLFLFSCKPDKNPVLPPAVNPKKFTAELDRDFTWKAIVREYCLNCNPVYDSTYNEGTIRFSLEVLNDSTLYRGTIDYNKLSKNDLFHFIRHDEQEKYVYFECLEQISFSQSLKYYYDENRVELTSKLDSAGVRGIDILYISQ
jgi:hypothetical protein